MDIGVDQGYPQGDLIELPDGSNRFKDPVTGTFMIDRFDLTFDQYRARRRYNMNRKAFAIANNIQQQRQQQLNQQLNQLSPPITNISTYVKPKKPIYLPTKPTSHIRLYIGVLLITVALIIIAQKGA